MDRKAQQAAIYALKSKVAGTSIRNDAKSYESLGAVWQTNSQYVHKPLTDTSPIDAQARNEQRKKLTQSNFGMGKANVGYYTTNKLSHGAMSGEYFSKTQRKEKADINSKTNFIA